MECEWRSDRSVAPLLLHMAEHLVVEAPLGERCVKRTDCGDASIGSEVVHHARAIGRGCVTHHAGSRDVRHRLLPPPFAFSQRRIEQPMDEVADVRRLIGLKRRPEGHYRTVPRRNPAAYTESRSLIQPIEPYSSSTHARRPSASALSHAS